MPRVMSKNKRMVLYDRNTNVKCCPRPSPPTPFPPPSCFARPSVRLPRCISPDYSLFCPVFLSLSSPVSHCLSVSLCACLLHHSGLTYITPGHQFCIWLMHYDAWIFYGGKVPSGAVSLKTHMHALMHTLAHTHTRTRSINQSRGSCCADISPPSNNTQEQHRGLFRGRQTWRKTARSERRR